MNDQRLADYSARRVAAPSADAVVSEIVSTPARRRRHSFHSIIRATTFKVAVFGTVAAIGLGAVGYAAYVSTTPATANEPSNTPTAVTIEDLAAQRADDVAATGESIQASNEQVILDGRQELLSSQAKAISSEADRITNLSTFLWPTEGSISKGNGFGMRYHPILRRTRLHSGADIGGACGAPIYAAQTGEVSKADAGGYNGGSGNNIRIDHGDINGTRVETAYLHMSEVLVDVGQKVNKGDLIGKVGETGLATSCHLHLSLYKNGTSSDPLEYVKKTGAQAGTESEEVDDGQGPKDDS